VDEEVDDGPEHTIRGLPIGVPGAQHPAPRRRRRRLAGTELLGRYRVESVIGTGGMATVYRGRHATLHRELAIKVLDPALDGVPDAVERFLQEAQVTSRVVHENVVEVNDFGVTEDGVVFCVMELLNGENLAQLIASEGPLPTSRAVAIMLQICAALQAAHEHGVIHRDLKPENCFRAPRTSNADFIKVLDFGIARVADDGTGDRLRRRARPRRTQVGCIVGTPDYMAPEQARAERFDHRVDVYAAGCLAYTLLTGKAPYRRSSAAETIAAHLCAPIPDPRELVPTLSPAIAEVVCRAMAKLPDDRYADMVALSVALRQALHAPLPVRRRRSWLVATATIAASLALAAATVSIHDPPSAGIAMAGLAAVPPMPSPPPPPPQIVTTAPPPVEVVVAPPPLVIAAPPPEPVASAPIEPPPVRRKWRPRRVAATPIAATQLADTPLPSHAKISDVKDPFTAPP
jgi:serine/threonine-protein kinase